MTFCDLPSMQTHAQTIKLSGYHYTNIIVVRACVHACVRACVRTDGSSPEASRPRRQKLCFFAKLKSGAATRDRLTDTASNGY